VKNLGINRVYRTHLGNAKSFLFILDLSLKLPDDQIIYFVEDDYIHTEGSDVLISEGLDRADYVSLYDHLDKYMDNSPNPLVKHGGEQTKVILTESTHWKFTNSTTMTFAARVKTLKEDAAIFRKHCQHPSGFPHDYELFCELLSKGRKLITPIPARSTHCEARYISPLVDWKGQINDTIR